MTRPRTIHSLISAFATVVVLLSTSALFAADAPANPSYSTTSGDILKNHEFGVFKLGATGATFDFDIYNLPAPSGTTSSMTLSGVSPFGDYSALSLQGTISGLAPAAHSTMHFVLTTNQRGRLAVSYTLAFTSDTIQNSPVALLALSGHAIVSPPGDYDSDGDVDSTDYGIWRSHFGSNDAAADGNLNGIIDAADFVVWRKNYSGPMGIGSSAEDSGLLASAAVPEPAAAILGIVCAAFLCLRARVRKA